MDGIRQERLNEGSILNFYKRLHRQSLNKKSGKYVERYMVFKTLGI